MLLDVPADKVTKISKINTILGISAADSEVYLGEGAVQKIIEGLGSLKNSTKRQYLTVVSSILSNNNLDNSKYCEAMRELDKNPTVTLDESCIEPVIKLLQHKDSGIRVLAGIVYYTIGDGVCFEDIIKTTITETDNDKLPLLDLVKKTWRIRHDGIATRFVPVPDEFVEHVRPICGTTWLLEDRGRQKYADIKNISRNFTTANGGVPFKEVRMFYSNFKKNQADPEIIGPAQPKKIGVCLKGDIVVDPAVVCKDMNISDASKNIYVQNVMSLQTAVLGVNSKLLIGKFCTSETFEKVREHLLTCKPNVACNKIVALCRIMEACNMPAKNCVEYHGLAVACQTRVSNEPRRPTMLFTDIISEIKRVFDSPKTSVSLRVVMLVILHSIKCDEYDIGVLRLHDFIHTRLSYDEKYSYIDWDRKVWHIRKEYTKNKNEREIRLSDDFIAQLRALYDGVNTNWMVFMEKNALNQHIEPTKYNTTDSLSEMIERRTGCSITSIRASYVSYIHDDFFTTEKCIELAKHMGHRHITAMEDYIRDIYEQGETE